MPRDDVIDVPTRDLLTAMHEEGWYAYPATGEGRMQVVSPDHTRSMIVELVDLETSRLVAEIQDQTLPLAWATTYVRGEK
jgi:hypothetical protein